MCGEDKEQHKGERQGRNMEGRVSVERGRDIGWPEGEGEEWVVKETGSGGRREVG